MNAKFRFLNIVKVGVSMLPDFIRIKAKFQEIAISLLQESAVCSSAFRESPRTCIFEGNRGSFRFEDGDKLESPYKDISAEMSITEQEIIEKGFDAWLERLSAVADQMQRQWVQVLLEEADRVTRKTGNVVRGKNASVSPEDYLEMFEKIEIRFDNRGNPEIPELMGNPANLAKFQKDWDANPEFEEKRKAILKTKKGEWDDRESRRKLVD